MEQRNDAVAGRNMKLFFKVMKNVKDFYDER